ncbi:MAG: hypothetical protein II917_07315, partial [Synergistaceae bacterium]|nr:hypothetical protein [Synergistaceae bacterium]
FDEISPEKFTVFYNYEPVDDIIVDEYGLFTVPAEMVNGDFTLSVKANDEDYEYESDELSIGAVSDQDSETEKE